MGKVDFKPGNMLYPLPAVLVTVRDGEGRDNVFTAAWVGTVCTNPPMLTVSVRPERFSYKAICQTGEFVVNLTTREMARAVDFCGVRSGRTLDKFSETGLSREEAVKVNVPSLKDSPVNIECRVREEYPLGSHHMFLADVVHVTVDETLMDEKGSFHLDWAKPLVYSHGGYFAEGEKLGTFGFSVRRKPVIRGKSSGRKEADAKADARGTGGEALRKKSLKKMSSGRRRGVKGRGPGPGKGSGKKSRF